MSPLDGRITSSVSWVGLRGHYSTACGNTIDTSDSTLARAMIKLLSKTARCPGAYATIGRTGARASSEQFDLASVDSIERVVAMALKIALGAAVALMAVLGYVGFRRDLRRGVLALAGTLLGAILVGFWGASWGQSLAA